MMKIKAEMNGNQVVLTVGGQNLILTIKEAQEICKALHGELYV